MPITLADAQAASQSKLYTKVIDEFRKDALLDSLIFDDTVKPQGGKTLTYNYDRVTTLPTAASRAIGSEFSAQEAKVTQCGVNLKIFGGSFEVDRVIQNYETQLFDHIRFQIEQKTKATRAKFADMFINGDSGVTATDFDGLDKAVTGSSTEVIPSAAINLSTSSNIDSNWKVLLDYLRAVRAKLDGAPTLHLMNSAMFAVFQSVMDRAGINLASKQNYGDEVLQWGSSLLMALGDKPGTANPIIPITSKKTAIYTVRIGLDGVHGVSPEGGKLINIYLPDMTAPGAVKKGEVEMVAAMALKATRAAGVLREIQIEA